jgi:uridine phosphorylase
MRDAIIQPRRGRNSPALGALALLAATEADVDVLRNRLAFGTVAPRRLYNSQLYTDADIHPNVCLAGPVMGAPYAVMVMETLIAWGARNVIFLGWCGAVSQPPFIGDLVVPSSALIDEGTSAHYPPTASVSAPSELLTQRLIDACVGEGLTTVQGVVWTTDGVFRETSDKVARHQRDGVLAVDMEASALFSVGRFRGADAAALLVVSDDLSSLTWRPGFKDPAFARGRDSACQVICRICSSFMVS